jgi:hypothetical protein
MNRETIEGSIKWTELVRVNDIGLNSNEKLSGKVYQAEYKGRAVVVFKCLVKIQTEEFEYNWVPEFKLIMLDNKGKIDWEFPRRRAISDLYESVRFKVSGTHIPNITSDGHRRYQQEQLDEYIGINKMRYAIIKTPDYLLICDDSKIEGYYYDDYVKKVRHSGGAEYAENSITKNIVAHLPLNEAQFLDGVPVLPSIEVTDFEYKLRHASMYEIQNEFGEDVMYNLDVFIKGYNKSREKYKFTEEDLMESMLLISEYYTDYLENGLNDEFDGHKKALEIIQSVQQPKYPIGFECQMEFNGVNHAQGLQPTGHPLMDVAIMQNYKPKTITNSEGRVELVGKYIW